MKAIPLIVLVVLAGAPSTFGLGVQCDPESTALLKLTFVGQGTDEFGLIETVDLRAVCRNRQMLHVETYARPHSALVGGVVKGTVLEEHFHSLVAAMQAIRIGVMTSCAVGEPFDSEFSARFTWLGRNGRRNYFTIARDGSSELRRCTGAETAFAVTALSLFFDSAEEVTFTTFP